MLRIRPSRAAASRGPHVWGLRADQAEADPAEKVPVLFAGAFPSLGSALCFDGVNRPLLEVNGGR